MTTSLFYTPVLDEISQHQWKSMLNLGSYRNHLEPGAPVKQIQPVLLPTNRLPPISRNEI